MKSGFTKIEFVMIITLAVVIVAIALQVVEGKIEEAKWSEGRAMAGAIAISLQTYAAENGKGGNYGVNAPSAAELGFARSSLKGTYFTASDFKWTTGLNSNGTLMFSIEITKGDNVRSPNRYALNDKGQWRQRE